MGGIEISEHLPHQAKVVDKLAIIRSAYHTNAGHGMGSQWMLTGWQPTIEVNDNIYPALGPWSRRRRALNEPGLPRHVNLPRMLAMARRPTWVRRTTHSLPRTTPTPTTSKFAICGCRAG